MKREEVFINDVAYKNKKQIKSYNVSVFKFYVPLYLTGELIDKL